MDRIKERLASLRQEADASVDRAEAAEAKNKKYEQEILTRDQEISSLQHQLALRDAEIEKLEGHVSVAKHAKEEGETSKSANDNLTRKVQLLEEELDSAEKNAKETVEKLRQVDVKAEHFERQVQRVEQERDQWEKKYEEVLQKYQKSQDDLEALSREIEQV